MSYYLNEIPSSEATLAVLDSQGEAIRRFSSVNDHDSGEPSLPAEPGMNRFIWDMRYPVATGVEGGEESDVPLGPLAPPGEYQVELSVGDDTQRQTFELVKDPNVEATQQDFAEQLAPVGGCPRQAVGGQRGGQSDSLDSAIGCRVDEACRGTR